MDSDAHVTFVGTGSDLTLYRWVITLLLIGLVLVALGLFISNLFHPHVGPIDIEKPVFDVGVNRPSLNLNPRANTIALREGQSHANRAWIGGANISGMSPPRNASNPFPGN